MSNPATIRATLVKHLHGGKAFMPIDLLLQKISFSQLGKRPAGLPYSFYELFYHIKYTQKDILEYCLQKNYIAPEWPRDYWPKNMQPESEDSWKELTSGYFNDRGELAALILSDDLELSDYVPSGKDHTYFREILLVIEHTSYHTGQLLILLRHLGLHTS